MRVRPYRTNHPNTDTLHYLTVQYFHHATLHHSNCSFDGRQMRFAKERSSSKPHIWDSQKQNAGCPMEVLLPIIGFADADIIFDIIELWVENVLSNDTGIRTTMLNMDGEISLGTEVFEQHHTQTRIAVPVAPCSILFTLPLIMRFGANPISLLTAELLGESSFQIHRCSHH